MRDDAVGKAIEAIAIFQYRNETSLTQLGGKVDHDSCQQRKTPLE
jgi:hypothetical protein